MMFLSIKFQLVKIPHVTLLVIKIVHFISDNALKVLTSMVNHVPNHVMDVKFVLEGVLTPLVGGVGILGKYEIFIF